MDVKLLDGSLSWRFGVYENVSRTCFRTGNAGACAVTLSRDTGIFRPLPRNCAMVGGGGKLPFSEINTGKKSYITWWRVGVGGGISVDGYRVQFKIYNAYLLLYTCT